jgi:hypothetical protein
MDRLYLYAAIRRHGIVRLYPFLPQAKKDTASPNPPRPAPDFRPGRISNASIHGRLGSSLWRRPMFRLLVCLWLNYFFQNRNGNVTQQGNDVKKISGGNPV